MQNSEINIFNVTIPTIEGSNFEFTIHPGSSVIFVGANGSGKTRLAVYLENIPNYTVHRISAHRALSLNPKVEKIDEDTAIRFFRYGTDIQGATNLHRISNRWHGKQATHLLNDFDLVLQALFAEFGNVAARTHKKVAESHKNKNKTENIDWQETKFEKLIHIWENLLPHRKIELSGDDIRVRTNGCHSSYSASELSDGERAMFYLIGQTLLASENCLLIIDEPELHVHKSLMSNLWDLLESERQDCAFLFVTHDLDFATSRPDKKIVLLEYEHPDKWKLEEKLDSYELNEKIMTLILGSRKPILFVEGAENSLDKAIYSACFPKWTIVPCGSCEEVIRSVTAMKKHKNLNWISCAGVVDGDDRDLNDRNRLEENRIGVLPVSIIENLFLLPKVCKEIAEHERYGDEDIKDILQQLKNAIFTNVGKTEVQVSIINKYCHRIVYNRLKKIKMRDSKSISDLAKLYTEEISTIDIESMAAKKRGEIMDAINNQDLEKLLGIYNIKGLLSILAREVRNNKQKDFEDWIIRYIRAEENSKLVQAIQSKLRNVESTISKSQ